MTDPDRSAQSRRGPDRGGARAPRRRGVPIVIALAAALIALGGGIAIGYAVRGEPPPASLQTVEREVPVVTVTVPSRGGS